MRSATAIYPSPNSTDSTGLNGRPYRHALRTGGAGAFAQHLRPIFRPNYAGNIRNHGPGSPYPKARLTQTQRVRLHCFGNPATELDGPAAQQKCLVAAARAALAAASGDSTRSMAIWTASSAGGATSQVWSPITGLPI